MCWLLAHPVSTLLPFIHARAASSSRSYLGVPRPETGSHPLVASKPLQEAAQKVEDSMVGVVVPTWTGAAEPGVEEVAKEEAA